MDSPIRHKKFDSELLRPNLDVENKDNPFYNKRVVFTGDHEGMERAVAAQLIQAWAQISTPRSANATNIVILGRAHGPAKMKKVESLLAEGHEIRIMEEGEFLKLVKK